MAERDEWVPSFYDGYETRWSDEDQCYIARCSPEYGLLAFVKTHGDTREEAVQKLVEILPDVACMNHSTHDAWVQRARKAEAEIARLRASTPEGSEEWTATVRTGPYVEIETPGVRLTSGPFHDTAEAEKVAAELRKRLPSPPSHDVEALREALEEIAKRPHSYGCSYSGYRNLPCGCHVQIARRALSQSVERIDDDQADRIRRLRDALEPFARFACGDPEGTAREGCECHNCNARRTLDALSTHAGDEG